MIRPNRDLCIMACCFCKESEFQKWVATQLAAQSMLCPTNISKEDCAKAYILHVCDVTSRNDLDRNPAAAELFHERIRRPYLAWKEENR